MIEQWVAAASRRSRTPARIILPVLAVAVLAGAGSGELVHVLRAHGASVTRPALPAFHGQAVWAAGTRPAPDFALRDQTGRNISLASLRGRPVILTFLDSQCKSSCPIEGRQLASVLRRLPPAQRPVLAIVSVDQAGDTPAGIRHALAKWGLAGPWSVHWLNGSTKGELAAVWRRYGIRVVPTSNDVVHSLALYLIDRRGYERTAYLFPFLPGFVQRDLGRLARAPA